VAGDSTLLWLENALLIETAIMYCPVVANAGPRCNWFSALPRVLFRAVDDFINGQGALFSRARIKDWTKWKLDVLFVHVC
jgi:hypothetical protein